MNCYSYIRFSSKKQAAGRSYERQMQATREFVQKKGWVLDESLCMFDLGLSGFRGEHKWKGQLGAFLEAVKQGQIQVPSALIVENLDRLSREAVYDALHEFLGIIKAGITIVTLMDRQIYDKESLKKEPYQLFASISIMARAHEESLTKQNRRVYAWDKAREGARNGVKMHARCVAWLKLDKEKNTFIEVPEHADTVRKIFKMYLDGHGTMSIYRVLNKEKRKTFQNSKNGWRSASVKLVLTSRSVLGEISFSNKIKNKADGKITKEVHEVIPDYYPPIISEKDFYAVQRLIALKKEQSGGYGKVGEMKNLFSRVVKCGYCGASMYYSSRGKKGLRYLSCSNARRKTCEIPNMFSLRYDHLEEAFLLLCKRLDVSDIVSHGYDENQQKIKGLEASICTLESKTHVSENAVQRLTDALLEGSEDTVKLFTKRIDAEHEVQRELKKEKEQVQNELLRLVSVHENTQRSLDSLLQVISDLNSDDHEIRLDCRRRMQLAIRKLVQVIKVYPAGKHYKEMLEQDREHTLSLGNKMTQLREVEIFFKGGGVLVLGNDANNNQLVCRIETSSDDKLTEESLEMFRNNPNISDEHYDTVKDHEVKL